MKTAKIDVKDKSLLVIGPLYNKIDKLYALQNLLTDKHIVVFLGDVCFPYDRYSDVIPRLEQIKQFMNSKESYFVLGDKDLTFMQKVFHAHADAYDWLKAQHIAIRFVFENNTSALIVHGGVLPKHTTWSEVNNDLEIAFIEKLPQVNKSWHKVYNGRFGYILSSHPANELNELEKSKHSISLDTNAHKTDKVAVQEFTDKGLGKTIYI